MKKNKNNDWSFARVSSPKNTITRSTNYPTPRPLHPTAAKIFATIDNNILNKRLGKWILNRYGLPALNRAKKIFAFIIGVELLLIAGAYSVWSQMNHDRDYRKYMNDNWPSTLENFYWICESVAKNTQARKDDYEAWAANAAAETTAAETAKSSDNVEECVAPEEIASSESILARVIEEKLPVVEVIPTEKENLLDSLLDSLDVETDVDIDSSESASSEIESEASVDPNETASSDSTILAKVIREKIPVIEISTLVDGGR